MNNKKRMMELVANTLFENNDFNLVKNTNTIEIHYDEFKDTFHPFKKDNAEVFIERLSANFPNVNFDEEINKIAKVKSPSFFKAIIIEGFMNSAAKKVHEYNKEKIAETLANLCFGKDWEWNQTPAHYKSIFVGNKSWSPFSVENTIAIAKILHNKKIMFLTQKELVSFTQMINEEPKETRRDIVFDQLMIIHEKLNTI